MLISILDKKGTEYNKDLYIGDVVSSGNKSVSVISKTYFARSIDSIKYTCSQCGDLSLLGKRHFFNKEYNMKYHLCRKCSFEKTSLENWGTKSPNQSEEIKQKQHTIEAHNKVKESINKFWNSTSAEYRQECGERQKIIMSNPKVKQKLSETSKKRWEDPFYREKVIKSIKYSQTPNERKLKSERTKKRWREGKYNHLLKYQNESERKEAIKLSKQKKNKTKNEKELSKLRSDNGKKLWADGVYDKLHGFRRVSNFQLQVFNSLSSSDWILEHPIKINSMKKYFIDIFNTKTNEIVECFGDYWHCNPNIYKEDYYHQRVHKIAKEIWEKDLQRVTDLEALGYKVTIIWESDWNKKDEKKR